MPLYEYKCNNCGEVSEFLIGVSREPEDPHCTSCGSPDIRRILSKSNFISGASSSVSRGGTTCCGREERCAHPACEGTDACRRI